MKDYSYWLKKFGRHISSEKSASLSQSLLASNYPQKVWGLDNRQQYKQVKVVKSKSLLILTSMAGRAIKIYSLKDLEKRGNEDRLIVPIFTKYFRHQVIEVCLDPEEKYAFFSLTDFGKEGLQDKLFCLNLNNFKKVFEIKTGGKWSKFIAFHPDKFLVVSNWHSNDLSIIDIQNVWRPKLIQIIRCGISPRGIDFTSDGKIGIVAGFYSRNLTFLEYCKEKRKFKISYISEPFDYPNYSGNMRHVVVERNNKFAWVSNMGRSLVHKVDLLQRKIISSYPTGSFPNTISLSEDQKFLAVSCRQSDAVCVLSTKNGNIKTIVDTGPQPTGLDFMAEKDNLYRLFFTNFEDDTVVCNRLFLSS